MNQPEYYYTINQNASAEFKDRGSKFIAYLYPIQSADDFKDKLQQLKKEHPKANHHCFAYRLGFDKNNFRVSDDGEPSGSAGKPILGQIDSKQLTNVLIVVVRYFGGSLLGVPGLINAYKTASVMVMQLVPITQKPVTQNCTLHFDYTQMNEVMRYVKAFNLEIVSQETQLFSTLTVEVPVKRKDEFENMIKELRVDYKFQ